MAQANRRSPRQLKLLSFPKFREFLSLEDLGSGCAIYLGTGQPYHISGPLQRSYASGLCLERAGTSGNERERAGAANAKCATRNAQRGTRGLAFVDGLL